MTRLVLHLGYPKTGTSSLQANVFAQLTDVFYLGDHFRREPRLDAREDEMERTVLLADSLHFDRALPRLQAGYAGLAQSAQGRTVVLSHERFLRGTGHFNQGGVRDFRATFRRLADVFGDIPGLDRPHALITIRSQLDLLPSYYAQFSSQEIKAGFYEPGFDRFLDFCFEHPFWGFGPHLDFAGVFDELEAAFGAGRAVVIPMEGLFRPGGATALAAVLGVDPEAVEALLERPAANVKRVREGGADYVVPRRRGGLARKALGLLGEASTAALGRTGKAADLRRALRAGVLKATAAPPESLVVSDAAKARIAEYYAASNRRLETRCPLGLAGLGYPT